MRTLIYSLLVLAILLIARVHLEAHAAFEMSVWDQMKYTSSGVTATIVPFRTHTEMAAIEYIPKGQTEPRKIRLCTDFETNLESEMRAVFTKQRLEILQRAGEDGTLVELGIRGPWNPCLDSVRALKGKSLAQVP
ncbi:MAG: hypothetical protein AB7G93_15090 [Bdellovibrionales bacterium]